MHERNSSYFLQPKLDDTHFMGGELEESGS